MKLALAFILVAPVALADPLPSPTPSPGPVSQHDHGGGGEAKAEPKAVTPKDTPAASSPEKQAETSSLATAVAARTPEEEANRSGFQIITQLDHTLGIGTFVDARYYSLLAATLTLQGQYLFGIKGKRLAASASLAANYEYTLPDAETGRRLTIAGLRFGVSAPALWREKVTGIAVSPSLGLSIPSSQEAFAAGLITSVSLGVGLSRSVKSFDFRANLGGSRGFYTNPMNAIRNPGTDLRDQYGNLLFVCRAGEVFCSSVGMNTAWSFNVGGSVQYRATGELMLYAGYTFSKSWAYAATDVVDDATPKGVDSNGNPVARIGMGQRDRTASFLGASYQVNDHYSLDLGLQTTQAPLTATGQVRFPFFAFGALADNASTLFFSLAAAY